MRYAVRFALVCWCVLLAGASYGQGPIRTTVTIDLPSAELGSVLDTLFADSDKTCVVDQTLEAIMLPKISIEDVPFDAALHSILSGVGLTFAVQDKVYVISQKPNPSPDKAATSLHSETKASTSVKLLGMPRVAVKDALGKPDRIVYTRIAGCENWYYGDQVVKFQNCRVAALVDVEQSSPVVVGAARSIRGPSPWRTVPASFSSGGLGYRPNSSSSLRYTGFLADQRAYWTSPFRSDLSRQLTPGGPYFSRRTGFFVLGK